MKDRNAQLFYSALHALHVLHGKKVLVLLVLLLVFLVHGARAHESRPAYLDDSEDSDTAGRDQIKNVHWPKEAVDAPKVLVR
jgi:hypothetical protein